MKTETPKSIKRVEQKYIKKSSNIGNKTKRYNLLLNALMQHLCASEH